MALKTLSVCVPSLSGIHWAGRVTLDGSLRLLLSRR